MSLSGGLNPLDFPHHKLSHPTLPLHLGSYPIFTPADFLHKTHTIAIIMHPIITVKKSEKVEC